jgi:hypothetical protein
MNELLPCPFCRCNGEVVAVQNGNGYFVRCVYVNCEAEGPWAETESKAIAKWNARVALDTTQAQALLVGEEIATLQAEVTRLRAMLKAMEWPLDADQVPYCLWCQRDQSDGHAADCQLALGVT